jgi:hypothetical protein
MTSKIRVVARFLNGRTLKGVTWDFVPNKDSFHLAHAEDEKKVTTVSVAELKAVFFVRSFEGDRNRKDGNVPPRFATAPGRKLRVTFLDGEVLLGTTTAYTPGRQGFFVVPADPSENNERAYVFTHATKDVRFVAAAAAEPAASYGAGR